MHSSPVTSGHCGGERGPGTAAGEETGGEDSGKWTVSDWPSWHLLINHGFPSSGVLDLRWEMETETDETHKSRSDP